MGLILAYHDRSDGGLFVVRQREALGVAGEVDAQGDLFLFMLHLEQDPFRCDGHGPPHF